MTDDDLIEPYAVPEIFVDGFTRHASRSGVMTCVGYRVMPEGKVVVIRLVWPAVNTVEAIDDAVNAMNAAVRH
jgi:hypothetical protein